MGGSLNKAVCPHQIPLIAKNLCFIWVFNLPFSCPWLFSLLYYVNKRTGEINTFLYWKLKRAPRKNITIGQQYFLIQISLPGSFQITHIEFLLTLPSKVNRDSDNLFLLLGPNTLGNTSAIIVVWYPDSEWHYWGCYFMTS